MILVEIAPNTYVNLEQVRYIKRCNEDGKWFFEFYLCDHDMIRSEEIESESLAHRWFSERILYILSTYVTRNGSRINGIDID